MFDSLKRFFGFGDDGYEDRVKYAINLFDKSTNEYDVALAQVFKLNRDKTLNMDKVFEWMETPGFDKEKMRDSISRFYTLIK